MEYFKSIYKKGTYNWAVDQVTQCRKMRAQALVKTTGLPIQMALSELCKQAGDNDVDELMSEKIGANHQEFLAFIRQFSKMDLKH